MTRQARLQTRAPWEGGGTTVCTRLTPNNKPAHVERRGVVFEELRGKQGEW
jgi:hypothetical protein